MQLFTIGYATKPITTFMTQLKHHGVDVVADVRSVPYSKIFKEYHKESIEMHLRNNGIRYVYLGEELGPRSKDPAHYNASGQVQFDRLMKSVLFQNGISRLDTGLSKRFTIALMCAEKDPAICHRSLLIGYYLKRRVSSGSLPGGEVSISHILHDGTLEDQHQLEARVTALHSTGTDLFMTDDECSQQAYQKQLEQTSYTKPATS